MEDGYAMRIKAGWTRCGEAESLRRRILSYLLAPMVEPWEFHNCLIETKFMTRQTIFESIRNAVLKKDSQRRYWLLGMHII
ncbi:MAG: hypothetical protein Q9206_002451 [Seirophora lacunosa]